MTRHEKIKLKFITSALKRVSNLIGPDEEHLIHFLQKHPQDKALKVPKFWGFNVSIENIDGCQCYVIKRKRTNTINNRAIMYIHGGGFTMQIIPPHWHFIKRLIKATNCVAYVPIIPLTTKDYSSCNDDIHCLIDTYKLILRNHKPKDITIIGDSAGASLTLITGQQLKVHNLPAPKNLIPMSPLLDASISDAEIQEMAKLDAYLPFGLIYAGVRWFVNKGDDPKKPIYSPMYGDCKDIGYITLIVGTDEGFLKENRQFHQKLISENIEHTYYEEEGMPHVFPIFPIKESQKAFDLIVKTILG